MFGDILTKLKDAKEKAEQTKARLNTVLVTGYSPEKRVKVVATANREIKEIELDDSLQFGNKNELSNHLVLAVNDAIGKANKINETEMAAAAKDIMPNIPGLGNLGNMFK